MQKKILEASIITVQCWNTAIHVLFADWLNLGRLKRLKRAIVEYGSWRFLGKKISENELSISCWSMLPAVWVGFELDGPFLAMEGFLGRVFSLKHLAAGIKKMDYVCVFSWVCSGLFFCSFFWFWCGLHLRGHAHVCWICLWCKWILCRFLSIYTL